MEKIQAVSGNQRKFALKQIEESRAEPEVPNIGDTVMINGTSSLGVVSDVDCEIPNNEVWVKVSGFTLTYDIRDLTIFKRAV